jgi:hypothetical protein
MENIKVENAINYVSALVFGIVLIASGIVWMPHLLSHLFSFLQ